MLRDKRRNSTKRRLVLLLAFSLTIIVAGIAGIVYVLASSEQTFSSSVTVNYDLTDEVQVVTSYAFSGDETWTVLNDGAADAMYSGSGNVINTITDDLDLSNHRFIVFEFMITTKKMTNLSHCVLDGVCNNHLVDVDRSFEKLSVSDFNYYLTGSKDTIECYLTPYSIRNSDEVVYLYIKFETPNNAQFTNLDTNLTINLVAEEMISETSTANVFNVPNGYPQEGQIYIGNYSDSNAMVLDYKGFATRYNSGSLQNISPRYISVDDYENGESFHYGGWDFEHRSAISGITLTGDEELLDLTHNPFPWPIGLIYGTYDEDLEKRLPFNIPETVTFIRLPASIYIILQNAFYGNELEALYVGYGTWVMENYETEETAEYTFAGDGATFAEWLSSNSSYSVVGSVDYLRRQYDGDDYTGYLDEGVRYISPEGLYYTFDGTNYHVVDIPDYVTDIDLTDTSQWIFGSHPVVSMNTMNMSNRANLATFNVPEDIVVSSSGSGGVSLIKANPMLLTGGQNNSTYFNFQNCTSLTSVTVPSCVDTITATTFDNCTSLTSITILAETPPTLETGALDGLNSPTIYIFADVNQQVITSTGWGSYSSDIDKLLPRAYQQVEYISSTGTQYINVGPIFSSLNNIIYFKGKSDSNSRIATLFGLYNGEGQDFAMNIVNSVAVQIWNGSVVPFNVDFNQGEIYDVVYSQSQVTVNNISRTNTNPSTSAANCYLFAYNDFRNQSPSQLTAGRCYYLRVNNGTSDILNLIPCYRKSDDEVGMYDLVNGVFYTNEGTGEFIAGPD